jgi:SHS2 domain-containing protein
MLPSNSSNGSDWTKTLERRFELSHEERFQLLEHVSDGYVEVYGNTLEEAFENVGFSLFAMMTEIKDVEPQRKIELEVVGEDMEALLFEWLSELIAQFDITHLLMSKFKIKNIKSSKKGILLSAEAWGEELDLRKHVSRVDVKAATYDRMEIIEKPNNIIIRYVVDL